MFEIDMLIFNEFINITLSIILIFFLLKLIDEIIYF